MLISKKCNIKINPKTFKKYKDLGYHFEHVGDIIEINIEHLGKCSREKVDVKCDYCECVYSIEYNRYNLYKEKSFIDKDACNCCFQTKAKESFKMKYNKDNASQVKEFQDKKIKNNIQKYGVDNTTKLESVKQKMKETNIKKYGTACPLQNEEIMNKSRKTCLEKYGNEDPRKTSEIKEKRKNTLLQRYGVTHPLKYRLFLNKSILSRSKYGNMTCSKQQYHLYEILKGELNYPFNTFYIDIFNRDDNIAIEYIGGGHNLSVKLNKISQEEFDKKEDYRRNFILKNNMRIIEFISIKNKLPSDDLIIKIYAFCKNEFNKNNEKYIKIYIDENVIKDSNNNIYKFNQLP